MVTTSDESDVNDGNDQAGRIWEIDHGYDVVAADGETVGAVQDVQSHYLTISKGFFFPTERHIPLDAIDDVRDERVHLSVTKDQVDSDRWKSVPDAPNRSDTVTIGYPHGDRTRRVDPEGSERETSTPVPASAFHELDTTIEFHDDAADVVTRAGVRDAVERDSDVAQRT